MLLKKDLIVLNSTLKLIFFFYVWIDQLNAYIDDLATQFDFVNTVSIGKSHEGRDMRVIQIAKAGPGAPNVWIEAGIHARCHSQTVITKYMGRMYSV